mmetsp:Transcript_34075/g.68672  ORF Transcript_34075/g.68672 Transcript_34075/m.68672 type:complete len:130 (+) Transcript_34075:152-541(+)
MLNAYSNRERESRIRATMMGLLVLFWFFLACLGTTSTVASQSLRGVGGSAMSVRGGKAEKAGGPWAFQCALKGWEKTSCLKLDGCAWCDTMEYGGACVTEAFAERVKDWSTFKCQMTHDAQITTAVHVE